MKVFVPYRSDNGHRARLWQHCRQRWQDQGFEPVEIDADRPDFNRSAAQNTVSKLDWSVAVFADADVVLQTSAQVESAAKQALLKNGLVYAHDWRAGLGEAETDLVLQGSDINLLPREEWNRNTWSSCYAVSRVLWDRVKGFDERFIGWGFEDLSFMHSCEALGKVDRTQGIVYHLWHERLRSQREEQPHHSKNQVLWERYRAARHNARAMAVIIAERNEVNL